MFCEIRPFKNHDGSIDKSRWWIKTFDSDLRYWACAGTKEKSVLYRSTYHYYFSSYEEAKEVATQNSLQVIEE